MEAPRFSVVMAAHDSAATIGAAIGSVRLQTREDWELVVVDDGSHDDTAEIAAATGDPRVRVVRQENRGPSAARNAGIAVARAPLVCLLDSDDLWLPHFLAATADALASEPAASAAYTDAWVLDHRSGRIRKTSEMAYQRPPRRPPPSPDAFLRELLRRNFVYNSTVVRREALLAVGGYDERLWVAEDWELWLRLAARGYGFVRAPGLLAVHRERAGSLASDAERLARGVAEVYRLVAEEWDTSPEVRELASSLRQIGEARARRRAAAVALLAPVVSARRAIRGRTLWHRHPPHEVASLLTAVHGARCPARES